MTNLLMSLGFIAFSVIGLTGFCAIIIKIAEQ